MKEFIYSHIILPVSILLFLFLTPTITFSGFILAEHVFGFLPDSGLCRTVKKWFIFLFHYQIHSQIGIPVSMKNQEKLGILISSGIWLLLKIVLLSDSPLILQWDKTTQDLVLILNFLVGIFIICFMMTDIGIIKMVVGKEKNELNQ